MLQEKRRNNRVRAKLKVLLESKSDPYSGFTIDISIQGCRICLLENLKKGESVIINLQTPVNHWVSLRGVVVHQTKYGEYGMKFEQLYDTEVFLVNSIVDYLQSK